MESLIRSPLTDPPFAFKKKLFWENKQRKKASSAPGYNNPYLSALDVAVVVLVVPERKHCWYEDDLMYLPTWPTDVTRRCRPRPRPRRDCCSAWRLRHLLRAENATAI